MADGDNLNIIRYEEREFFPNEDTLSICKLYSKSMATIAKELVKYNNIYTNIQIKIGEHSIGCHLTVLQCYSKYFEKVAPNTKQVEIPSDQISAKVFAEVYDWMLIDEPIIQRNGIIKLYEAAKYLEIAELEMQCWEYMDNEKNFSEETAFFLYKEAHLLNNKLIKDLMLQRVCKFFLVLVSSKDFLEIDFAEVSEILQLSSIAVNYEIELLFAGFRWLTYEWPKRKEHAFDIVTLVRYSIMSPMQLIHFSKCALSQNYEDSNIRGVTQVMETADFQDIILNSTVFVTSVCWQNRVGVTANNHPLLKRLNILPPVHRFWIRNIPHICLCHLHLYEAYDKFLNYLITLRNAPTEYYTTLSLTEVDPNECNCKTSKSFNYFREFYNSNYKEI